MRLGHAQRNKHGYLYSIYNAETDRIAVPGTIFSVYNLNLVDLDGMARKIPQTFEFDGDDSESNVFLPASQNGAMNAHGIPNTAFMFCFVLNSCHKSSNHVCSVLIQN